MSSVLTVGKAAVVADGGVDGDNIASVGTKVVEELCNTLLAVDILAERIDYPDLTEVDSSGKSSRFVVSWDELHVLDTASLENQSQRRQRT
jgi:hypothetical protein